MKRFGVIEQSHKNAIPAAIVNAAKNRSLTPTLLYEELVLQPICNQKIDHISILSSRSIDLLMDAIPEVIKNNPLRYPFLFPKASGDDGMGYEMLWKMSDPDELRNATLCASNNYHNKRER